MEDIMKFNIIYFLLFAISFYIDRKQSEKIEAQQVVINHLLDALLQTQKSSLLNSQGIMLLAERP